MAVVLNFYRWPCCGIYLNEDDNGDGAAVNC